MARIESLSILTASGEGQAYLAEQYGAVIENIFKNCISAEIKNNDISGDIMAGSVEAKRFANATINNYGTARSNGGTKIKAGTVTVALNQHKEAIEEVNDFDTKAFGVEGLVERRLANQQRTFISHLDKAFFTAAYQEGTFFSPSEGATTIEAKIDELIVSLETTANDYVDGVNREDMVLVLSPAKYTELQAKIDTLPGIGGVQYQVFHNVIVKSTNHLPQGCDAVIMARGTIAEPVRWTPDDAGKFPASNDYHFGLFCDYGVKVTNPECVKYIGTQYSNFQ